MKIKRGSQPTVPVGTFKVQSVVSAFVTICSMRLTAEKGVVRSNAKVVSVQKKAEVKDSSGSFNKKVLKLCKKDDCLLNVAEVVHEFGSSSETNVRQKRSEGTPPSRGKPPQGPGGPDASCKGPRPPSCRLRGGTL